MFPNVDVAETWDLEGPQGMRKLFGEATKSSWHCYATKEISISRPYSLIKAI